MYAPIREDFSAYSHIPTRGESRCSLSFLASFAIVCRFDLNV